VKFIYPDWPAPSHIKALTTTRKGGFSKQPFDSFNLALHVNDDVEQVLKNRHLLNQSLPSSPFWLSQTHTNKVVELTADTSNTPPNESFDGSFTSQAGVVCTVMTADCLPILLTDIQGSFVAAVHAGWRGLADGIIENSLSNIKTDTSDVLAWLGPAIGPECFEVEYDMKNQFADDEQAAFKVYGDKWLCDIYALAVKRLNKLGVSKIYGGDHCTFKEDEQFYSYRRDGVCGRMASCIWIES
jgi:YfiH family protein